jgi:hypothetical protein
LTRLNVNANVPMTAVTLKLVASAVGADEFSATYAGVTIPAVGNPPLKVGLYLPSSMMGEVGVRGTALDGSCEIGSGTATIADVQSGAVREASMTLTFRACEIPPPPPDAGAQVDAGPVDRGGAPDVPAIDVGREAAREVAPEVAVEVAPEVPCVSNPMAITCGRRCNTDVIDNCGRTTRCGGCNNPGETCGGAGTPNMCGRCVDDGQACLNRACGEVTNNCGEMVNCGMCNLRQECCEGRCSVGICL